MMTLAAIIMKIMRRSRYVNQLGAFSPKAFDQTLLPPWMIIAGSALPPVALHAAAMTIDKMIT